MPLRMRSGVIHYDWLSVLIGQVKYLYNFLLGYRFTVRYDILHNSQVLSLETLLNDKMLPTGGNIYITDFNWVDANYYFNGDEVILVEENYWFNSGETNTNQEYLYNQAEVDADSYDFIVWIQATDYADINFINRVKGYVNRYKLAGFSYLVQSYT
jgi:hypothetical protein